MGQDEGEHRGAMIEESPLPIRRYVRTDDMSKIFSRERGVVADAGFRSTSLPGIQIPPPERAVEPPNVFSFSTTTALCPWATTVKAAVMPAAPLPTTTTSNSSLVTRTGYNFWVSQGRSTIETDVLVVGFGAAGACAAIEASDEGAEVLIIDRFGGGGATALSGGVVYAGGGTRQQQQAGVEDTHEAMYKYLRREIDNVVSADTLGEFCRESPRMLQWLEEQGVPFDSSLCPYKTSYPNNDYYLYYSGSEQAFTEVATPAPRGHRTFGKGTSGRVFFDRLAEAVRRRGIEVLTQTTAQELITDDLGRVVGVKCRALRRGRVHRVLNRWSAKPFLYVPKVGRMMHKVVEWLERRRSAKTITIMARKGVILAAGGFVNNRHMMRQHAPAYRGGLPLGTPGDNGSGINLGAAVGGATAHMDRISVWRFLTPPSAMLDGLLVDRKASASATRPATGPRSVTPSSATEARPGS